MLVLANILQPLIDLNEAILKFWHDTVGLGWGFSVVGLTIVIRLAILPLTYKQVRSMQEMQRFSPEIQRLRERYKGDKTRQNEELMKLYQEHGFNPLGSCLPLVLQLPFFFGLYQTLRSQSFIHDVHSSGGGQFLFIPDITKPLTGHTAALIVMIILYVGSQLGSSYVSSLSVQDKNQRRLLFIFPFVFVPVVINFEAGLLIYWITTNLFTIGQQLAIRKFLPAPEPHVAGALAATGSGGKSGAKGGGDDGNGGGGGGRKRRRGPDRAGAGAGDGKPEEKPARGRAAKAAAEPAAKPAKGATASNGGGDGGPRKAPPPSPRKKKKRTGRRR
jgi:YidC/Oxa1 family membrane protein insertase